MSSLNVSIISGILQQINCTECSSWTDMQSDLKICMPPRKLKKIFAKNLVMHFNGYGIVDVHSTKCDTWMFLGFGIQCKDYRVIAAQYY